MVSAQKHGVIGGRRNKPDRSASAGSGKVSTPLQVFQLPFVLTFALFLLAFIPRVQQSPLLFWSFIGAAATLLALQIALILQLRRLAVSDAGAAMSQRHLQIILRPQHYVQAMVQASVFAYWGYHWQPVYDHVPLLVAQLLFAYTFDMLLSWSRRESYALGFGPFPIIFSINLFLWFQDDWFYMQFLMIAAGFMGKEFIRWQRDGRLTHIFNPSAFALGLFSLVLLVTGTTELTWGPEIASTLTLAPNIYTFLFLVGLIVMYFFSITLVAGMAALVLFIMSALYSTATGVPYFLDSEIPAAVFLGLHLLITDPSTSPRTPLGKALFGGLYGLGVFVLYWLLGAIGVPTFYDKLLCVPLLNLSVRVIDQVVHSIRAQPWWSVWQQDFVPRRTNLIHMFVWVMLFGVMTTLGRTDGRHTGDALPFWQEVCAADRANACERLIQLESTYCGDNSGWACNELGLHYLPDGISSPGGTVEADHELAIGYFSRACELRFQPGCINLLEPDIAVRADPRELDLRLLLREGGQNLLETPENELYGRACAHGWEFACGRSASSL
ncbi:MAG: hypothetical protein WDZ76_02410 [Pseudohongiellaceae bacterium]